MESKRKVYDPNSLAQYYESISDCLLFNSAIDKQRAYDRKRRSLIHSDGYESVLNRSKRAQLAFPQLPNTLNSVNGMIPSAHSSTLNALKPPTINQTTTQPKLQQNILPMGDAINKQFAAKYVKNSNIPSQNIQLKPLESQGVKADAMFTIGSEVVVQHTDKLAAYGLAHLIGKKGKVISVPAAKGQFLYGIMFDTTLQHVPLEALASFDAAISSTGQMKLPASSQLKLEHSFHMHRLMQDQFKEIQALQKQHAEYRVANNTSAMADIQKSLAVLRNLHLSQIRVLKGKQEEELRQKELT
ncbi:Aste57867_25492 [Aphanomyces stellatus]|uniref:Aste57867_25492 protein n=1 Tax=Aphanomyces stellatus TaxID=120398 RepID=A0A485LT79_9STRA|nr:hypothetical protein As57867_025413 [Aphanomyces stellatus]VFU02115.1 Aste57867_25492 [Aphanomyces stellatus]